MPVMAAPKFKANILTSKPENDFQLIQKIGSGTYGDVFKANVKATGELAAIKIINIEPGDDFDVIQQESIIMQDCNHVNIVKYHGSYLRKDKLWIAMEFCGGGSLQDIYHVTGALSEPMIAFICNEMLSGLKHMHQQKKVHRDIKGANVLLTTDGDVKLADFGVGAQITSTIGKRSSFIGTPYWMAPEVAAVERTGGYDYLCDIWAVGITAIELAECQPPLYEHHPMRALYLISKKHYTPPTLNSKSKTKWSNYFKDFLKQALTKNPKKRPDADRLLHHAFCNDGRKSTKRVLRELLDRFDAQKKEKYDRSNFVTGDTTDEDENGPSQENKDEKPPEKATTVKKRIQSRKEPKKKGPAPQPPSRPQRPNIDDDIDKPDAATLKPSLKKSLPPPPPSGPLPEPPSVEHVTITEPEKEQVPPPLPPRDTNTSRLSIQDAETLTNKTMMDPPPLPPRSPIGRRKAQNGRPLSQLFVQKPAKNCFTKIFNECPLTLNCAASWKHPGSEDNCLLFASNEGIYSLTLGDNNVEMVQIFSRSCKWLYVFKNILVSVCGKDSNVYMHNLVSLHERREQNAESFVPKPRGIAFTTKIPGTSHTLKCCVAHNPYNNEMYLYAGRVDGILMLQWYEPLQKFMIVKDISVSLPPELSVFEPIVRKGVEHTSICVGAYYLDNGDFTIDEIDIGETESNWQARPGMKKVDVRSFSQLEPDLILMAYDKCVQFIDINGKRVNFENRVTQLYFDHQINNAICLPGSVLTFNTHGVQGKGLHDNQQTAHFQDTSRTYKLLCSDRIVVIESVTKGDTASSDRQSNLYILANEQG